MKRMIVSEATDLLQRWALLSLRRIMHQNKATTSPIIIGLARVRSSLK